MEVRKFHNCKSQSTRRDTRLQISYSPLVQLQPLWRLLSFSSCSGQNNLRRNESSLLFHCRKRRAICRFRRDGRMLAFVSPNDASGANMLTVQRIGSPAALVLQGTEGASYPFWSPDDAYVAFFADGHLKKIPAAGGVPQILANATSAARRQLGTQRRHSLCTRIGWVPVDGQCRRQ